MAITVLPSITPNSASWIAASASLSSALRRLVQDQDRRVLQDHPRQRHALALAARKLHAPFAHLRVIPCPALRILQPQDEVMCIGPLRRGDHFVLGRAGPAIQDVLPHRPVQQRRILLHHADGPA
jgi:hypothetical protein